MAKTEKRDLHREITDKIVAAIEAGAGEWRLPWVGHKGGMPVNAITGKAYRGVNIITLWLEGTARAYPSQEWASYKQWQAKGAQVRKGERGAMIVYYDAITREATNSATGETIEEHIPFLKYSHVFNASQVDGYQPAPVPRPNLAARIETAERFVMASGATVQYGLARAFYSQSRDIIGMPDWDAFIDTATASATENAYGTLLHELTHWTGHPSRCARDFAKRFGNEAYAAEELVAELGAAFLCGEIGIEAEPRADHAQYLSHWLVILKSDKRAIFTAASKASAAVDYLNAMQGAPVPAARPAEPVIASVATEPEPAPAEPAPAVAASVSLADIGVKSYKRSEKWIGDYCIRRVPCFSRNAPTVHAVIYRDRWVNSYLDASRAVAWARAQSRMAA